MAAPRDERSLVSPCARVPSPATVARVVFLLESLPDVLPAASAAAWDSAGGHEAPRSVLLSFSPMFRAGSYLELLRSLSRLRSALLEPYRAVRGRYLEAERRVMVLPVQRTRWGARVQLPANCELAGGLAPTTGGHARVVVRRWAPDVDEAAVVDGVRWLAGDMHGGRADRIVVPRELVAA